VTEKFIKYDPIKVAFVKLRLRVLGEAWEKKKAELIASGYPPEKLEIPDAKKSAVVTTHAWGSPRNWSPKCARCFCT
jgi:hypothetical protein